MNADINKAREIFIEAVGKVPPEQWESLLVARCGDDAELYHHVQHLLRAHQEAGSFLDHPAVDENAVPTGAVAAAAPPAEAPGTRIGPYKLLQQIGEGGMGIVYLAEQLEPVQRRVALKIIKAGLDSAQVVGRFEQERQALALMDHPHIAKVFDGGTTAGGRPYFVMELVKGTPITKYCDEHRLTPRQRLELFVPLCQAIQHAHQKGVIHRDVKPSNVLVAPYDGRPVVKVIDFGIAKATGQKLTERTLFTGFGAVVGTLEYMSPEQAELNNQDIDTRSDIYGLGVLLYELLTGTTPLTKARLKQAAFTEMLRVIREEEPPRPSTRLSESTEALASISAQRQTEPAKLAKLLRGELDWIVMKALEKDRARRYETANGLARDLERYLADEPVEACPPSAGYRLRKFARKYRNALTVSAAFALLLVLGVVASTWQAVRATRAEGEATAARDKTQAALNREREALERERQNAYYQRIALAEREWTANNVSRYDRLLDECPDNLRGWEWHYLKRLRYKTLAPLRHDAAVLSAAVSPDSRRIASGSQDGIVKVWDAPTGRELAGFVAHEGQVAGVAFSPDGQRLATGSWDGIVKLWDVEALTNDRSASPLLILKGHAGRVDYVAFCPDGRQLASSSAGIGQNVGEIKIWDAPTGTAVRTLASPEGNVYCVAFSPDGQHLASAGADKTVRLWNVNTGHEQQILRGHTEVVWGVAFSPDGQRLASGGGQAFDSLEGELKIWDLQTCQEIFALRGHTGTVLSVAFSPDGKRLASGSSDQTVKLWDVATGHEALTLHGHFANVRAVTFSPDGRRLISASHDWSVRIWDGAPILDEKDPGAVSLAGHRDAVTGVAFSPRDRRLLASASLDGTVRLWDARTGKLRRTLDLHPRPARAVAFSPDGRYLAVGAKAPGASEIVAVWDTTTWQEVPALSLPPKMTPWSLAFSPEGRYLAVGGTVGGGDFIVTICEVAGGKRIHELRGHSWHIRGLAYSPDGRLLASASTDGTVRLWDVTTGKETDSSPLRHAGPVLGVAFRPDGRRLASAGWDRTVRIWDTTTWKQLHVLRDPTGGAWSVAYSPDGQRLAWGATDATVKVWDEATEEIRTLRGHTSRVQGVAFSPDGTQIASASADGTVKIWEAPPVAEAPRQPVK
jgi:WD40 repeat protein/serine/threonine protein kinase